MRVRTFFITGFFILQAAAAQAKVFSCVNVTSEKVVGTCKTQMKNARCEQWFQDHPQAQAKARSCDPVKVCTMPMLVKKYAEKCSEGVWNSSVDFVKGTIDFVIGDKSLPPDVKAREEFFKSCTSAECKIQMLGPYADLFSPEEIVGSPNTRGLDPADVVNQVYLNGYSAKTLYRKLLTKLRERAQSGSTNDVFIEPWSGRPAAKARSVDDLIDEVLTAAGLQNTACFDPEALVEARCYALATVLDPLTAAVAVARIKKITSLMRVADQKAMTKALAKDDLIRTRMMRGSAIESDKLKAIMDPIWKNTSLSYEQKAQALFDKYYELRRTAMEPPVQNLSDKVLRDVRYTKGDNASYDMLAQRMNMGRELADDPLNRVITMAHELEHVTQYPYRTSLIDQFQNLLEMKLKNLDKPRGVTSQLQAEFEAMSAQWDIIQAVPKDIRLKSIEAIRANKNISPAAKASAIGDIERADLSRMEYLKSVAPLHNYTSYNSVRTRNNLIVAAFLVQMSVVGADEAFSKYTGGKTGNAH
ncbi:hypothetical protein ACLVWU_11520 [Bdellovibrio sp. HCB290]|uniref:hypothetical protein n=1 Tax=Bdellovibrio sp. HCB290 TaxID=3394356 RepID=UPI0039B56004